MMYICLLESFVDELHGFIEVDGKVELLVVFARHVLVVGNGALGVGQLDVEGSGKHCLNAMLLEGVEVLGCLDIADENAALTLNRVQYALDILWESFGGAVECHGILEME